MRNLFGKSVFLISCVALAAGCASSGRHGFDKAELASAQPLSTFSKIYIAPVGVDLDPREADRRLGQGQRNVGIPQEDREDRAEVLRKELAEAFDGKYDVVSEPDGETLTIAATLTRIEPTLPTAAQLSTELTLSPTGSIRAGGGAVEFVLMADDTVLAELDDSITTSFLDGRPRVAIWTDLDYAYDRWTTRLVRYVENN